MAGAGFSLRWVSAHQFRASHGLKSVCSLKPAPLIYKSARASNGEIRVAR